MPRAKATAETTQEIRVDALDINQVSNGAENSIIRPYGLRLTIQGTAPLLMHGWNVEAVEAKGAAQKGSAAKKTDDLESYVYRTKEGHLALPGSYIVANLADGARYDQDPRSPRASARGLVKAGLVSLDILAPFLPLTKSWDYLDKRRVVVQRNAVTRTRPAMLEGWKIQFNILVIAPQYLPPRFLLELATRTGQLCGFADFRPTYGRYAVAGFETYEAGLVIPD